MNGKIWQYKTTLLYDFILMEMEDQEIIVKEPSVCYLKIYPPRFPSLPAIMLIMRICKV